MNMYGTRGARQKAGRVVAVVLCSVLLCSALTGCRSSRPKDGTYTARYQYPSNGFVEYLKVTFRDGRPTDVEFDAYLETDPETRKSELSQEEYPMTPHPNQWMNDLEDNIKNAGLKPDKIATVAGATSSSRHARELYDAILTAAKDGKTGEILVKNEEEGPDSGMTGNSTDSGLLHENNGLTNGDVGANDGTESSGDMSSNSSTIPGLNDTNSSSMNSGMTDSTGMENSASGNTGVATDSSGQENVTGGDGTGTGSSQNGNSGMGGTGTGGTGTGSTGTGNTGTGSTGAGGTAGSAGTP